MSYKYGTKEWYEQYDALTRQRVESESRPYILATPEWCFEFQKAINEDSEYRELNEGLVATDILQILAKPDVGIERDLYILLRLEDGGCSSLRVVPEEEAEEVGDVIISGPYENWKSVLKQEIDVIKAILGAKLEVRGDFSLVMTYARGAVRLVELAAFTKPAFQDELSTANLDNFKATIKKIRTEFGV